MISSVVHEAACPVIAILDTRNAAHVEEAAKRGVFAYVALDGDAEELRGALDITLRRFAEFTKLQGAFARRALIEQAKGILMARNRIDADRAYELLKARSQGTGQKISDIAKSITTATRSSRANRRPDPPHRGRGTGVARAAATDDDNGRAG
jgi:response regulator NasT